MRSIDAGVPHALARARGAELLQTWVDETLRPPALWTSGDARPGDIDPEGEGLVPDADELTGSATALLHRASSCAAFGRAGLPLRLRRAL